MKRTRPLFQFDAGWLFLAAGLALCVVVVLIPAQRNLFELRQQLAELQAQERHASQRLQAYQQFLAALHDDENAALVERLAATQFNVLPVGETPVLLVTNRNAAVTDWIDEQVPPPAPESVSWPDTRLTRLAIGPLRLWLLGAGVMSVFIGLIIGTETFARVMRESPDGDATDNEVIDAKPSDLDTVVHVSNATHVAAFAVLDEPDAGKDVVLDWDDEAELEDVDESEEEDLEEGDEEMEWENAADDNEEDELNGEPTGSDDDGEVDEDDAYDDEKESEDAEADEIDEDEWEDEDEVAEDDELEDTFDEAASDADEESEEAIRIVTIAPHERLAGDSTVAPTEANSAAGCDGRAFSEGLFDRSSDSAH